VQEHAGRGVVDAGLLDTRRDAVDEAGRRRQRLGEGERARRVVEDGEIGERAADVCREATAGGDDRTAYRFSIGA
jgi:hypothetical protein